MFDASTCNSIHFVEEVLKRLSASENLFASLQQVLGPFCGLIPGIIAKILGNNLDENMSIQGKFSGSTVLFQKHEDLQSYAKVSVFLHLSSKFQKKDVAGSLQPRQVVPPSCRKSILAQIWMCF